MSILISFLITTSVAIDSTSDADVAWHSFKSTFVRQYRNLREEEVRKDIFVRNCNQVHAHNKRFDHGLETYSLKVNQYADWTHDEITKTLNGYKQMDRSKVDVVKFIPQDNLQVFDEFDWRQKKAVTRVKDQGSCGSCWAFSASGALESQYFLKTGKLVPISEQNLVDCSLENSACSGGDMNLAFSYVHDQDGIDSEVSYPYKGENGTCQYTDANNVTSARGYGLIEMGNEEHLKAAIATIGPIAIGIDAGQFGFFYYMGGVYYSNSCHNGIDNITELNHGVLAVGYGTEDGQDYWLVKNSWGKTWGDNGYIKMARNRNNSCGVATAASFPLNY